MSASVELQHTEEQSESGGRRGRDRPIFSAYEVGKTARTVHELERLTAGRAVVLNENTTTTELHELYQQFPEVDYLAVRRDDGRITGYLRKQMFFAALSQNQFTRDLLLKPNTPVSGVMETRVVTLDSHTRLSDASRILMGRDEEIRFDPFVVLHEGEFYGVSSVRRVLDALNYYFSQDLEACNDAQEQVLDNSTYRPPVGTGQAVEHTMQAAVRVLPLTGPGGDYGAVYELSENLTLLLLFDVCGKGLKAAQMVLSIATAVRTMLEFNGRPVTDFQSFDLGGRLTTLNRMIFETTPEGMYATGVAMLYEKNHRILQLYDYGHALVWLRRKDKIYNLCESIEFDATNGVPFFGIDPHLRVRGKNFQLRPDDTLFVCSDGINEAKNPEKEEFGMDHINRTLLELPAGSAPGDVLDHVLRRWEEFRNGYRKLDDVSMLAATIE